MCTQTLPKRLQADVFERFSYFGVKLLAAYHVHADTPKTSAGRRFEHVSYFGVKLLAAIAIGFRATGILLRV